MDHNIKANAPTRVFRDIANTNQVNRPVAQNNPANQMAPNEQRANPINNGLPFPNPELRIRLDLISVQFSFFSFNRRNYSVPEPAASAIRNNDLEFMHALIQEHNLPELNANPSHRQTLRPNPSHNPNVLAYAAYLGQVKMLEFLLSAGANPKAENYLAVEAAIANHQVLAEKTLFTHPNIFSNGQLPSNPGLRHRTLMNIMTHHPQDLTLVLSTETLNARDVRQALTIVHQNAQLELIHYLEHEPGLTSIPVGNQAQILNNIFEHRLYGWLEQEQRLVALTDFLLKRQARNTL